MGPLWVIHILMFERRFRKLKVLKVKIFSELMEIAQKIFNNRKSQEDKQKNWKKKILLELSNLKEVTIQEV